MRRTHSSFHPDVRIDDYDALLARSRPHRTAGATDRLDAWLFLEYVEYVVDATTYKTGWGFEVLFYGDRTGPSHIKVRVAYDGTGDYGAEPWTGRVWPLVETMRPTEIVYTLFKAVMAAEEHETREFFKFEEVEVCGPHFDVRDIVRLVKESRLGHDVRTDAMQGAS